MSFAKYDFCFCTRKSEVHQRSNQKDGTIPLQRRIFWSISKKISTLILKDGSIHKGYCNDLEMKKGQIYEISIKDSATKKPEKFNAEIVSEMYIFPTNFEKGMLAAKHYSSVRSMTTRKVSKTVTKDRIHFVNQTVSLKNKKDEMEFLMQVINPEFDDIISVYHDPRAKEQGGSYAGFGPGIAPSLGSNAGVIKSYYIKKGDKVIWLHKDDFDDNYEFLFGDNPEFMKKYPLKSVEWCYFSFLVAQYTEMSNS